ncbi:hypothetical protein FHL15_006421 [Xylaria flabelliformis]|uniref:Heterokaryon incompatibility domain-containing protein n=1 Tax=Xylaria flabelliformis TaxID=2512241 RepID=A0A553HXS6_9PEZI|nr:hypothetical protein FHL15_006421 [Xylaria flabelliformis]
MPSLHLRIYVLTGRHQRHGDEEGPGANAESVYEIEFLIHPDSKALFVSNSQLPTEFHVGNPVPEATDLEETVTRSITGIHIVLDCVSKVRLLETQADILSSSIDYVCLSHCWAGQWLQILEEYTSLALTFVWDRFPALSGTAQLSCQFRNGDKYVAGLWEGEMLLGLTSCASRLLRERPREWVAPTWSWASMNRVAWWPAKFLLTARGFLTLMKADCVLADPDLTGRLSSASLTRRGPVATGVLLWEDTGARKDRMFSVQFGSRKITGCFLPDYTLHTSADGHLVPNASEVR